ncbi:helicase HerA domain-containing protein [Methanobacterium sp. MBAC-LM]|uniref:helicase HerA domain-containing protein n=1 Tax=Methanobacterium sp. MBAC-LM TaxID=3412034 RepID=UPI003C714051
MTEDIIGRCIGENSLTELLFISKKMPKVGEFITIKYDGKEVIGMIDSLFRGSVSITEDIFNPETIDLIKTIEGDEHYIKGTVKILGDTKDNLRIPRTPAPPGTEIILASEKTLKEIFEIENGLTLGKLITHENVEIKVDIDTMVTRHLAILAVTGAGKSNTVAVIVDGLLEYNGSILIFDMHSEYINTDFNGKANLIKARINPQYLTLYELKKLANIREDAYVQGRYIWDAFKEVRKKIEKNVLTEDFLDAILEVLNGFEANAPNSKEKGTISAVINKIEFLKEQYAPIFDNGALKIIDNIKLNAANIIDLGSVDESASDIIVSHALHDILNSRKKFMKRNEDEEEIEGNDRELEFPVFIILEEAHILAPKGRRTNSKHLIGKIAREGRKFGVGLCMVSQRPKSLDSDSLSQANNMIILRLVEPQDQRHVQSASESLSDDLLAQLPSLNKGEAVVLGLMTKIPTLVKIGKFEGEHGGNDIKVLEEWKNALKKETEDLEKEAETHKSYQSAVNRIRDKKAAIEK